ncbi:Pentatricopeptide repeat-containing protein [Acorus calamus]|uniref:Pentatricopeptide repeat-containing protein n=1 Tax=Acorus calamus TaxID=4465 RepID=A0AAV9CMP5_ACOCL|nr:Pentatricopeptide repeat-containing protein [Acorus calamus]
MYGKCGDLESAKRVFEGMTMRDSVTWNALITGYAQNGVWDKAINTFQQMRSEGTIEPDNITMVGVLSACASIGALELGSWIDKHASQKGVRHDIYVGTALIDMYSKCGDLDRALQIFNDMPLRNTVSWNVMISALASHGRPQEALSLFGRMREEKDKRVSPDDITFIGVLSACVHVGWVEEGRGWFESMRAEFGLVPKIEHYTCMVDLLARAGRLDEACKFIESMPEKPDGVTLGTVLCACRKFNNVKVGERIANMLLEVEPSNSGNYVISSKLYANSKRWEDSAKMKGLMRERGVVKTPGCSWIEGDDQVHEFRSGDGSHYRAGEIYLMMDLLCEEMRIEGYIPNLSLV